MSEITKAEDQKPTAEGKYVWIFFAALVAFVYFFAVGSIPLIGPDEPRYAQVAREMFERNDWTTPTLGGFDWFEKPVLLYWLQIFSYRIFGVSEFAARFGSALCGLGTIFSLWILGKKVQSQSAENQSDVRDFANWLFLVAASSIGILVFARAASFDIILTFPVTASLVGFFIHDRADEKDSFTYNFSLVAFYFFIGVALLAKGLVGIVFPVAIAAFYFVLRRKLPDKTFVFSLIWGTLLSLAVASVWYVPMYLANGWKFIDEFFIQHQFQRYASNKFQHPQPVWFFLVVLPLMTVPWLPFFLAAIWNFVKAQSSKLKPENLQSFAPNDEPFAALKTFAAAWLLVPLVFFSFSGSKLPGYILPALPAAAILTAEIVWRFARGNFMRRRALQTLALATFAVVIIALQFFVDDYARRDTVKNLIEAATARGFANEKILNFNERFHNAEFYGARRLIRDESGRQKLFSTAAEIAEQLKRENSPSALVLSPRGAVDRLTDEKILDAEVLGDNGDAAIVAVKFK